MEGVLMDTMDNNVMFAVWLSNRLYFSTEDKRACFEIAEKLVSLAQDVRKNGLLWVDSQIPEMDGFFLRHALQLAVDSTHPVMLRAIMNNWIMFGDYRGVELLKRLIIIEGTVAIINGENPLQIKWKLAAFFGEDLVQEFMNVPTKTYSIEDFCNERKHFRITPFDEVIMSLDNLAMQILIRCIHESDLLIAFAVSPGDSLRQILTNMARNVADKFMEDWSYLRHKRQRDIDAAQEKILAKIKELEERGEIVVNKEK
jgi:hypothetical protein